jgi:hypothetical protein
MTNATHATDNSLKLSADFDLRAMDGDSARTPTFSIEAYTGTSIRQGWSRNPLVVDLAGMSAKNVPILYGHDAGSLDSVLGQSNSITNDGRVLSLSGDLIGEGPTAERVIALAKKGMRWQASIGADIHRIENVDSGQKVMVNGREFVGPISVVRASNLREVSIVLMGADANTSTRIAAELAKEDLHMADNANPQPTDKVEAAATGAVEKPVITQTLGIEAKGGDGAAADDKSPGATDVLRAELAKERAAREEQAKRLELMELRMSRAGSVGIHVAEPPRGEKVVEAALCLQAGLPNVDESFDERTLEAADKVRKTISISEVLVRAAKANGYSGSDRLSSGNLGQVLQASFATHQISDLLSAVVNKFLLSGFNAVESTWQNVSAIRSVSDFKSINMFRLNGSFKFQKIGTAGEIKVAAGSDYKRSVNADTYGIGTSLTRQEIINDDLNALSQIPQRIGRGAALSLNDVIWGEFQSSNDTYFQKVTAAAGNALSLASLKTAATAYRKLNDPDGNPLGIAPSLLLVPPELEITAAELMTSSLLIADGVGASASKAPSTNVLRGRYRVVVSNYLTSATTWWLMADGADLPALDVVFLNGQQVPTIEQVAADYQMLGVQMRGYMDFGVIKSEPLSTLGMRTA